MRMSPSWRQTDRQNHKGCEKKDRQTDADKNGEKKGRKRVKEL